MRILLALVLLAAPAARALEAAPAEPSGAPAPAPAEAPAVPAAAAPAPGGIPESVATMLAAKDDDGKPIFDDTEVHAYLKGMPSRVLDLLDEKITGQWLNGPEQLHTLLTAGLATQGLELALQDNCVLCHTDPDSQTKRTLFTVREDGSGQFSFRELTADVHYRQGLLCSGCHGGDPTAAEHTDDMVERWPKRSERKENRTWVPKFCARCHADGGFMRRFNPSLPTDQLAKYEGSKHGQLLLQKGDSKAAQCVSCHGVHGIRGKDSPLSRVNAKNIPETCGKCHADAEYMAGYLDEHGKPIETDMLEKYKASVHGKALLVKGDSGAPACNDCHGSHAALPPEVATVAQVCRNCHLAQGQLFDGSPHKKAFAKRDWPECGQCHGHHDIEKPGDELVGNKPGTLCHDCHAKESQDDPKCDETAGHFRSRLDGLVSGHEELVKAAAELREKGLDTEELTASVTDLDEAINQTRTKIHSFDKSTFDQAADAGKALLDKGGKAAETAWGEYRFRLRGLSISIGIMALLAITLYLRLRAHEANGGGH